LKHTIKKKKKKKNQKKTKQKKQKWLLPLCACNLGRYYFRNPWILKRISSICSLINWWIPSHKH